MSTTCEECKRSDWSEEDRKQCVQLYVLGIMFYIKVIRPMEEMVEEKSRKYIHSKDALVELTTHINKSMEEFNQAGGVQNVNLKHCAIELDGGVHHASVIIDIEGEEMAIFQSCASKDLVAFYYKGYEMLYISSDVVLQYQGFKPLKDNNVEGERYNYLVYRQRKGDSDTTYVLDVESDAVAQCMLVRVMGENKDLFVSPYSFITYMNQK